jgi:hypothetical protein
MQYRAERDFADLELKCLAGDVEEDIRRIGQGDG